MLKGKITTYIFQSCDRHSKKVPVYGYLLVSLGVLSFSFLGVWRERSRLQDHNVFFFFNSEHNVGYVRPGTDRRLLSVHGMWAVL